MYKLIILIISSNNLEIYSEMKRFSEIYLNQFNDKIKFYYLEYKQNQELKVYEEGNYLYFNGDESFIPGIYKKTVNAIEYINSKYNYEFILRTNLSSFLNIFNILSFLDTIPKTRYAGGYSFQGFISGTGIFMSKDVGNILIKDQSNENIGDDILISNIISRNNIVINDILNYKWGFLTSSNESLLPSNCEYISSGNFNENIQFSDNILYFRIRNEINRKIDLLYYKLLMKKIYNINIEIIINNIPIIIKQEIDVIIPIIVKPNIKKKYLYNSLLYLLKKL